MVGVVNDSTGAPVVGLAVKTLEERVRTDEQGLFAIQYKPPEQLVFFAHGGVNYSKRYLTSFDEGQSVVITLPQVHELSVSCQVETPCALKARWSFSRGLSGSVNAQCTPGQVVTFPAVPVETAAFSCTESGSDVANYVRQSQTEVVVYPPKQRVTVRVESRDAEPQRCLVLVAGSPAQPQATKYVAFSSGPTTVIGVCDGIPANPRVVMVSGESAEVVLSWGHGPTVAPSIWDLDAPPTNLWLVADREEDKSWVLRTHLQSDGRFSLPELDIGTYHIAMSATQAPPSGYEQPSTTIDAARARPNVMVVRQTKHGIFGSIVVTKPIVSGSVRLEEK